MELSLYPANDLEEYTGKLPFQICRWWMERWKKISQHEVASLQSPWNHFVRNACHCTKGCTTEILSAVLIAMEASLAIMSWRKTKMWYQMVSTMLCKVRNSLIWINSVIQKLLKRSGPDFFDHCNRKTTYIPMHGWIKGKNGVYDISSEQARRQISLLTLHGMARQGLPQLHTHYHYHYYD